MPEMLEALHHQLLERNATETTPFLSVHAANAALQNLVETLQSRCETLEREQVDFQQRIDELSEGNDSGSRKASLKSEARLRDKVEKLQEELNNKLRVDAENSTAALKAATELSKLKDVNAAQESTIENLRKENNRTEEMITHLTGEVQDAKNRAKLAEQQYAGLKNTIRTLTDENDELKETNRKLVDRIVTEKEKMVDQINKMNEINLKLQREVDMLKTLQKHEEKRSRGWFNRSGDSLDGKTHADGKSTNRKDGCGRRWGSTGVVVPSEPKHIVQAHPAEGTAVRYDGTGTDLVATSSSDCTVKVWDTNNGTARATLRGGSGHALLGCDISDGLAVGCGSDKTCRVWNLRTERMIHQLAGHSNKVTCVRLFNSAKCVITGSADRSLKVWDISRNTYRQTTTLRHSSTSNCVDMAPDSFTAVSGHMDGGVRFWDVRSGERTADISDLHSGGVTSTQIHPTNSTQILTNGRDSSLKIVDVRTCTAIYTLQHKDFRTTFNWSSSALSPDGTYAAAGSGTSGEVFLWRTLDGEFQRKLKGHDAGVVALAWGRGGSNGQQVASVDRNGGLILWA